MENIDGGECDGLIDIDITNKSLVYKTLGHRSFDFIHTVTVDDLFMLSNESQLFKWNLS